MQNRSLTSFDLFRFIEELDYLQGAVIRDVRSGKNEIFIELYKNQTFWLKLVPGKYFSVSNTKPKENIKFGFTEMMRSSFLNKRINLSMHRSDRILELDSLEKKLVVELFSKGNIILTNGGNIEHALFTRNYVSRNVSEGEVLIYPPEKFDFLHSEKKSILGELAKSDKQTVVKALAVDFSLGGVYSEEICYRAGIDKMKSPNKLLEEEKNAIYSAIEAILHEPLKPNIVNSEVLSVIDLTHLHTEKEYFKTINDAVINFFREETIRSKQKTTTKSQLENEINKLSSEIDFIKENYEKIYTAIELIKNSDVELEKRVEMLTKLGWGLNGKTITLLSAPNLSIDITRPIQFGTEQRYTKIKKLKNALSKSKIVTVRASKLDYVDESAWYSKFRWSTTSSGKLFIIGRDNNQNVSLIEKHVEKTDVILHADVFGSPFCILKCKDVEVTDLDLQECAKLVGAYSSAWKAGANSIDVYYVKPEQITKTPPSGEYLKRGSFYINGKREYIKKSALEIYIKIEFDQVQYKIIVLPYRPESNFIKLAPGNIKREEVLNRIQKECRENLSVELERDKLDRVLPQGRSKIEKIVFLTNTRKV